MLFIIWLLSVVVIAGILLAPANEVAKKVFLGFVGVPVGLALAASADLWVIGQSDIINCVFGGAILTGINVPRRIGKHWGPKPNPEIKALLQEDNLFKHLRNQGCSVGLANAYPPAFLEGIESGRRALSAIQLALKVAGVNLCTEADLRHGRAFPL